MGHMRILLYGLVAGVAAVWFLYHMAGLAIFNALAPRDGGATKVADGLSYGAHARQRFDLYRPAGSGPFPVLLFVYGGSWDSGRRQDYEFIGHAFAARGFLTAIADYRLIPEIHYPGFVEDTAAALAAVAQASGTYGGDPARLYIVGHSAGGYNVAQAVLSGATQRAGLAMERIKAVATLAGPFDFLPLDSPKSIAAFSQVADLPSTQPVNQDLSSAPPFLLLHGSADKTVGPHNSINLAERLKARGRPVELKTYESVSHAGIMLSLSRPLRGTAPVLDDILRFFQRYD